jgi:hypothetical protein
LLFLTILRCSSRDGFDDPVIVSEEIVVVVIVVEKIEKPANYDNEHDNDNDKNIICQDRFRMDTIQLSYMGSLLMVVPPGRWDQNKSGNFSIRRIMSPIFNYYASNFLQVSSRKKCTLFSIFLYNRHCVAGTLFFFPLGVMEEQNLLLHGGASWDNKLPSQKNPL